MYACRQIVLLLVYYSIVLLLCMVVTNILKNIDFLFQMINVVNILLVSGN